MSENDNGSQKMFINMNYYCWDGREPDLVKLEKTAVRLHKAYFAAHALDKIPVSEENFNELAEGQVQLMAEFSYPDSRPPSYSGLALRDDVKMEFLQACSLSPYPTGDEELDISGAGNIKFIGYCKDDCLIAVGMQKSRKL